MPKTFNRLVSIGLVSFFMNYFGNSFYAGHYGDKMNNIGTEIRLLNAQENVVREVRDVFHEALKS